MGAVGAKLVYPDGRIQHAGVLLGPNALAGHVGQFQPRHDMGYFGRIALASEFQAVHRRLPGDAAHTWERVGGTRRELKVAFNDIDFCLRISENGERVSYTPRAELVHYESASRGDDQSGQNFARFMGEVLWMRDRWGLQILHDPYYNPNLARGHRLFELAYPPRVSPWYTGDRVMAEGGSSDASGARVPGAPPDATSLVEARRRWSAYRAEIWLTLAGPRPGRARGGAAPVAARHADLPTGGGTRGAGLCAAPPMASTICGAARAVAHFPSVTNRPGRRHRPAPAPAPMTSTSSRWVTRTNIGGSSSQRRSRGRGVDRRRGRDGPSGRRRRSRDGRVGRGERGGPRLRRRARPRRDGRAPTRRAPRPSRLGGAVELRRDGTGGPLSKVLPA